MKDLLQHAFDFFAYIIPGLFVIFSLSILVVPDLTPETAIEYTKDFDAGLATVFVIVAYVVGFCIYPVGRMLYKTLGFKLFGNRILADSNHSNISVPTKYALLREHSPMNFKYVESWNIYCAMSHNLMVASLIFCIVSIVKMVLALMDGASTGVLIWFGALLMGILIFLILTQRAVTYFHWAAYDINATIASLDLKDLSEEK